MKNFAFNWLVVTNFVALFVFVALTSGCTWTTHRPLDPHKEKRSADQMIHDDLGSCSCRERATQRIDKTGSPNKFDEFIKGEIASGRAKKLSAKIRFVPVLLGRDTFGIRLFGLPADHALLKRGYVPGEILASFNGETFSPANHKNIGRVMLGQLDDVHLTVIREDREVTLGSKAMTVGSREGVGVEIFPEDTLDLKLLGTMGYYPTGRTTCPEIPEFTLQGGGFPPCQTGSTF